MSQEQARQFLMQGIEAARAGEKDQARQLFQNTLRLDPQNEAAWLWMSSVARDNRERLFCLQNVLQINPQNETAIKGVRALGVDPATLVQAQEQTPTGGAARASAAPTAGVPALVPDRLNVILPSVDEFMRSYQPLPISLSETSWELKRGMRYGELLARRRQATRYALIGVAGLIGLTVIGFLLISLLTGGEQGFQIGGRPTITPSFTPTNTATATPGVTNTPSPEPDDPIPTLEPPAGFPQGSIYGSTVTPVYPEVAVGLGRDFQQAVGNYSIGRYATAYPVFEERQQQLQNANQCDPVTYYFHIVGLSEEGGRANLDDAHALYDEALNRAGTDCENSYILFTAACFADYSQYLVTPNEDLYEQALGWCEAAMSPDYRGANRPITLAATTLARLLLLAEEPDYVAATGELQTALEQWPGDLNILLTLADVEVERGDLNNALNYISAALYVDPLSEPALQKRVSAYLDIAEGIEDDDQRALQLYGTAVIWSQEYLLFYAGSPQAYLLLARARRGEGNIDLAEEALTRVIEARATLPEDDQASVREAFDLRATLYAEKFRYEDALTDIETMLRDDPENLTLIRRQSDYAYLAGRYPLALEGLNRVLAEANLSDSARNLREMRRLRLITQICTFIEGVECNYAGALETLTDAFINGLTSDDDQAEALSFRAQARYRLAEESANPVREYDLAQADIERSIDQSETAVSQYYRGLILEALNESEEALTAYDWILYWSNFYDYPFTDDVQERVAALRPEEAGAEDTGG